MNKRVLNKKQAEFLQEELTYLQAENIISQEDASRINSAYVTEKQLSFLTVITALGSLLLGLGILAFVASNWMYFTKTIKFLLIIAGLLGANWGGAACAARYPKTSRSLYYTGILIYGAGIFLIEQMFNFNIDFSRSFLLWAAGIVLIGVYLKDQAILLFTAGLLFVFINGISWSGNAYPYTIFIFFILLYYVLKQIRKPVLLTFIINALSVNTIAQFLTHWFSGPLGSHTAVFVHSLLFLLGLYLIWGPLPKQILPITRIQGHLLHGIAAIFLTYDFSIWFALLYFILLLYLIQKGSLTCIAAICALIFRYYLDSFEFLPKSLCFIIGGVLLLGFGLFFERYRQKGGASIDQ